jgi:acetoin utilization protein AcuB
MTANPQRFRMHKLRVRQIMTSNVVTVGPEQVVADAAALMEEHGVRHLPVIDDDDILIGIVTDNDIREAETAGSVLSSYEPEVDARWLTVADIMTTDVVTISPDTTVGELARVLIRHKIGGTPVVVPDVKYPSRHHLAGIVTETDIFTMLAEASEKEESA